MPVSIEHKERVLRNLGNSAAAPALAKDQIWMERDSRFVRAVKVLSFHDLDVAIITVRHDGGDKPGARITTVRRDRFERAFMHIRG